MKKSNKIYLVLVLLLSAGLVFSQTDIYFKISKAIDIFGRIYKEITLNYVDEIDPEEFMLAGIRGMLSSLDPYTVYIDENQQKDIELITTGKYGGIGATVSLKNGKVTIVDLIEGYSAQRQGIRIGDVIVSVDSVKITKDNYDELGSLLKKTPGTEIEVVVRREGVDEDLVFNLVSEEVEIKNLTYYAFVPPNSNNAYLKLSGFTRSAGAEVKNALFELEKQKEIKSIVLDLRGNPGGLLDAAVDVAEKFLKKGSLIVSVIGRDTTNVQKYFSREEPVAGKAKLAVLINGGSASASEILAGAIQDHDRGIIIGTPSFGKGLVQTVVPLSFNTSLKLTTAKYYTPSGRCIQKIDYSKNKVFTKHNLIVEEEFKTDNKRSVFSSGGIIPDSTVPERPESEQIEFLLARGMFFKFASFYFNTNNFSDLGLVSKNELFDRFVGYLDTQKINYTSKEEKVLAELTSMVEKKKYNSGLVEKLNNINEQLQKIKREELKKFKDEIVIEIMTELAARINGRKGRIEEMLKNDKQFKTAYHILNKPGLYRKILAAVD